MSDKPIGQYNELDCLRAIAAGVARTLTIDESGAIAGPITSEQFRAANGLNATTSRQSIALTAGAAAFASYADLHTLTDVTGSAPYALYEPSAQGLDDGDVVATITDSSGNGRDLGAYGEESSGAESTYEVLDNGVGVINYRTGFLDYGTAPTGDFSFVTSISPELVSASRLRYVAEIGAHWFGSNGGAGVAHLFSQDVGGGTVYGDTTVTPDEFRGKMVLSVTVKISAGVSTVKIYLNGRLYSTATHTFTGGSASIILGGNGAGYPTQWGNWMGTFALWNSTLTDAQRTRAEALVGQSDKVWDQVRIICDGNSITYGTELTDDQPPYPPSEAYPQQLRELLGSGYEVVNIGVGGQNTQDMLDDQATKVTGRLLHRFAPYQIVIAWEGTNQMATSTAQEAFDLIKEYCLTARAAGSLVIVGTQMLPPSASAREPYNVLIRAHWREFADEMVDFAAVIGTPENFADPAIFITGGPHLAPAGCAMAAEVVRDAVLRLRFI